MAAELFALVWEATLAGSAALLLVLALRRPLRAWLGASAAYALWLCVPVVLLAVLLPRGGGHGPGTGRFRFGHDRGRRVGGAGVGPRLPLVPAGSGQGDRGGLRHHARQHR